MLTIADKRGALQRLFLWLFLVTVSPLAGASCPAGDYDIESVRVAHVHDGDTLTLADKRKVRLIGIDTPELARKGKPAQPFALKARDALWRLVRDAGKRISLVLGKDEKDRYGRTLAHVYADGINFNAHLVEQGLAVAFTTPPNDRYSDCYHRLDREAESSGAGLWQHEKYAPIAVADLMSADTGFSIIDARIDEVKQTRSGLWLVALPLQVHIRNKDLEHFDRDALEALEAHRVRLRGWLHHDRHKPGSRRYMTLRHPSALQQLATSTR